MEPQHLDTFAASCALAAVLKDAGNIEAHMEGFGDLRVFWSFRSDLVYHDTTKIRTPAKWHEISVLA